MRLNRPQKIAIYLGGGIVLGMLLYPPWRIEVHSVPMVWTRMDYSARVEPEPFVRYSFVLGPPTRPARTAKLGPAGETTLSVRTVAKVDWALLLTQCAAVAVATGLAVFACSGLGKRPPQDET